MPTEKKLAEELIIEGDAENGDELNVASSQREVLTRAVDHSPILQRGTAP